MDDLLWCLKYRTDCPPAGALIKALAEGLGGGKKSNLKDLQTKEGKMHLEADLYSAFGGRGKTVKLNRKPKE